MDIALKQTTEYGALRTVVMCLAHPFDTDLARLAEVDEVVRRQMAANNYRPYDVTKVHAQQLTFARTMEAHGATVLFADPVPGAGAQHYPRDLGFVVGDVFFQARMRAPFRRVELQGLANIIGQLPRVARLDAGSIEGGDVMVHRDRVFVGLGEETTPEGVAALRRALVAQGLEHRVVELRFSGPGVIHLDTKFNIVGPELAVVDRSAFARESLAELERAFELIEATPDETRALDINLLTIADRTVALSAQSARLADRLAAHGVTPVPIDYSEVTALPGSLRCTTLPLERAA